MNRRWQLGMGSVFLAGVLLLAACTDSSDGSPGPATTSDQTSTTQKPIAQCADIDESEMTLVIDPKIASAGSVLYVVWADDERGAALSLDDGDQVWLLMVGFTEAEADTFPFETVGTYPPDDAYSPGAGYVRLPDSLRDGCYVVTGDSDSGTIIVRSSS